MRATEVENCTSLQSYDAVYFIFSFVKKKKQKKTNEAMTISTKAAYQYWYF